MRALCALIAAGIMSSGSLWAQSVQVGFEAVEGFHAGDQLQGTGWSVVGGSQAVITDQEKADGSQSLKIEAGSPAAEVQFAGSVASGTGVRFIDLSIKPVGMSPETAQTGLSAWGSEMGFVKGSDGKIQIAAMRETGGPSEMIATTLQSGTDDAANNWIRLTVRQDLTARTWDVYVDGKLSAIDLPLSGEGAGALAVFGSETAPTYLDKITVGDANPLFADLDKDGMPDAWEVANGLNRSVNDRNGDWNSNGVSNIADFMADPAINGNLPKSQRNEVIYVDNLNGNDANSGSVSYQVGGDGPKATIKAAMEAALRGAVIVILPGNGVYVEGSRGEPTKPLTIKTVDPITIK